MLKWLGIVKQHVSLCNVMTFESSNRNNHLKTHVSRGWNLPNCKGIFTWNSFHNQLFDGWLSNATWQDFFTKSEMLPTACQRAPWKGVNFFSPLHQKKTERVFFSREFLRIFLKVWKTLGFQTKVQNQLSMLCLKKNGIPGFDLADEKSKVALSESNSSPLKISQAPKRKFHISNHWYSPGSSIRVLFWGAWLMHFFRATNQLTKQSFNNERLILPRYQTYPKFGRQFRLPASHHHFSGIIY